jgi:hypothetical protein
VAWFFVALLAGDKGLLVVNHRWDSAALSVAGVTLLAAGLRQNSRWLIAGAGAAAAYGAWITPPVLLVLAPMFVWSFVALGWVGTVRLASGVVAVSTPAGLALIATGSLGPIVHHFAWAASQYSTANRFPYGGITGGYPALFAGAQGLELWIRAMLVFFIALPAVVPVCALLGLASARRMWKTPLVFILACAIALVISTAPRMDVSHLTYASPLSYLVAACVLASLVPGSVRTPLTMALSLGACIFVWNGVNSRLQLHTEQTRAGILFGDREDLALEHALEASVQKGEPFFAFPYVPVAYFLTQGANPTRYSFLQPGMMADSDEDQALASLKSAPPAKVFYMDVPECAYLRLFPSSDPTRLRMRNIENWLRENYDKDQRFAKRHPGYDLLIRRQAVLSSQVAMASLAVWPAPMEAASPHFQAARPKAVTPIYRAFFSGNKANAARASAASWVRPSAARWWRKSMARSWREMLRARSRAWRYSMPRAMGQDSSSTSTASDWREPPRARAASSAT